MRVSTAVIWEGRGAFFLSGAIAIDLISCVMVDLSQGFTGRNDSRGSSVDEANEWEAEKSEEY